MTPDDPIPSPLSPACVIVDALLDGETVDKHALREALGDPAARDYFVDALVLRQLTREMAPLTFVAPASAARTLRRPLRWVMSAAVLALVAAGGFLAGNRHDVAPNVDTAAMRDAATTAPAPTKIIRLEPGVSWTTEPARP
jgi:hypothetical protein